MINHLAYADDAIIFSSSDATSLRLIMEVLNAYEAASRQLINKAKSAVYVHHSTSDQVVRKIEGITGIQRKDFSFFYLGCPIFYKRRKMEYYEDLISKVLDKLQAWKGKLLSIGGRAILISSVLQTMPIRLLLCYGGTSGLSHLLELFYESKIFEEDACNCCALEK
ncbi:uncharacterized protein [Nicotiana sylvestris]|uniref:uncharacterized protein n=1 Tax=Nicotiana sylvestris TaxID=4096 RepID=UPI00388C8961